MCEVMMERYLLMACVMMLSLGSTGSAFAEAPDTDGGRGMGWRRGWNGGQCPPGAPGWCGKRKGDRYGARRAVTSVQDAEEQLRQYYSGQDATISGVTENPWHFQADVLDKDGKVIDRVIIDKRSGRVRSIF